MASQRRHAHGCPHGGSALLDLSSWDSSVHTDMPLTDSSAVASCMGTFTVSYPPLRRGPTSATVPQTSQLPLKRKTENATPKIFVPFSVLSTASEPEVTGPALWLRGRLGRQTLHVGGLVIDLPYGTGEGRQDEDGPSPQRRGLQSGDDVNTFAASPSPVPPAAISRIDEAALQRCRVADRRPATCIHPVVTIVYVPSPGDASSCPERANMRTYACLSLRLTALEGNPGTAGNSLRTCTSAFSKRRRPHR